MVRWLETQKETEPHELLGSVKVSVGHGDITDDPLAALGDNSNQIYSVTRSVVLPRLTINRSTDGATRFSFTGGGVNPLFKENMMYADISRKIRKNGCINRQARKTIDKSGSSGYGSSNTSNDKDPEESFTLDRTTKNIPKNGSVPSSSGSGSSFGTLNAIPEGKIDILPGIEQKPEENFDSIIDDRILLYTSLNYAPDPDKNAIDIHISVTELLVDILKNLNLALDDPTDRAEDILKNLIEKINRGLETMKNATDEDMRKLCVNLRNCKKVSSVLRAFGNSSNSSSSNWSASKSSDTDVSSCPEHFSCPSSTGGSSDSVKGGTEKIGVSLRAVSDEKPSVWEQYYGVRAEPSLKVPLTVPKPTDVPVFPGGRPEADFTLDVPRSEHLSKKMRQDKKWRFRCRLLTSFLGLVFFLLSVMAVSLMLTRGRRMFGSMM